MSLAFDDLGNGSPAVVLLHNVFCDRSGLRALAQLLAPKFRVLNIDLRGHGDSPKGAFTVTDLARDVRQLLDAQNIASATLLGVSLGAATALQLALEAPERVERMVLLSARADASGAIDRLRAVALGAWLKAFGVSPWIARAITAGLFGRTFHAQHSREVRAWRERVVALGPSGVTAAFDAWTLRPAFLDRLAELRMPVLLGRGEEDTTLDAAVVEDMRKALPSVRSVVLTGVGHSMPTEAPDRVASLVRDFVSEATGRAT